MTQYTAFLRGINLGKRRIKMDKLAALLEELKFANVATFLASGNVVLDAAAGEEEVVTAIEVHLRERLGYDVDTFVRTMDELQGIARRDVFAEVNASGWGLYVIFLRDALGPAEAQAIREMQTDDDKFEIHEREIYWLRNGRLSDSSISTANFTRRLDGASSTMRNMNTVMRIIDKFGKNAEDAA